MALDPQKIRAFAPLLSGEEYRRRRRRLRLMFWGNMLAVVGLSVVLPPDLGVYVDERLRMLLALALLCLTAMSTFSLYCLFTLRYDQWIARRARAFADKLEGSVL